MAVAMEGALDLSVREYDSKGSPVPSMSPEPADHSAGERSSSVSSESQETDGSMTTKVTPLSPEDLHHPHHLHHLAQQQVKAMMPPLLQVATSPPMNCGRSSPGSPKPPGSGGDSGGSGGSDPSLSPTGNRPFKMYPFDSLSGMYSQMAAAAAATTTSSPNAQPGAPLGGFPASPIAPQNMFDSAISLSSPIGQYLQQRKRRYDARVERQCEPEDKKSKIVPDLDKDDSYWERRRKNNEAAKRSRDARRAKEEEIAIRAAFLEQENLKLRAQVAILKNETAKLHYMLYNRM